MENVTEGKTWISGILKIRVKGENFSRYFDFIDILDASRHFCKVLGYDDLHSIVRYVNLRSSLNTSALLLELPILESCCFLYTNIWNIFSYNLIKPFFSQFIKVCSKTQQQMGLHWNALKKIQNVKINIKMDKKLQKHFYFLFLFFTKN